MIDSVVVVDDYFDHPHLKPFACGMHRLLGERFTFIEAGTIDKERRSLGWTGSADLPGFVIAHDVAQQDTGHIKDLIDSADVVIWANCPFSLVRHRIGQGKLTFTYSERIFKKGYRGIEYWGRFLKYFMRLGLYQRHHYLLCCSAYAAGDYWRMGLFRSRCYRWGYFPETKYYPENALMAKKHQGGCLSILWVARLIPLKHPEAVVELAALLKAEGHEFCLDMIGIGELEDEIGSLIKEKGLTDRVRLLGAMPPERVRQHMEEADIFLFTSDFNEGWGAVMNEAMNSGCAVVASHAIGSVPFLVKDGENGMIYKNGDLADLHAKVLKLMTDPKLRESMGREAYRTISDLWNAQTAAERFMALAEAFKNGTPPPSWEDQGPCSYVVGS